MANTIYSKTFSKADFFKAVIAIAEEVENDEVLACAQYELDKLVAEKEKAAAKRGTTGTADRMAGEYPRLLAEAILSVLDSTPKTADDIVAALNGKTIKGKAITLSPWLYCVLGGLAGTGKTGSTISEEGKKNINPKNVKVKETMAKKSKQDSKGLIREYLVKAYQLA